MRTITLSFICLFLSISNLVFAQFTITTIGSEKVLTGYTGSGGDVVIPDGVEKIGNSVFKDQVRISSITMPNTVKHIGENAFLGCSGLSSVNFSSSLTYIGPYAFRGCLGLRGLNLPNGLITIDSYAFYCCFSLKEVNIPASLQTLGESAFRYCEDLESVTFKTPSYLSVIGKEAFYDCLNLSSIILPELTYYTISIGDAAFSNCKSLEEIFIPKIITSLGKNMFIADTNLKNIYVDPANPNYSSVTGVLYNKGQTTLLAYPAGKTNENFMIPNTVNTLVENSFALSPHLVSVTFPNSLKTIEFGAFQLCPGMISVSLPSSLIDINGGAFSSENLKEILVDDSNPNYSSLDGVLYNKSQSKLITYPNGKKGTNFVIPNTVKTIAKYSFRFNETLLAITIPQSVTDIEDYAFWHTQIEKFTVQWEENPPIALDFYRAFDSNISPKLRIPEGTLRMYQRTGWNRFQLEEYNAQAMSINLVNQKKIDVYLNPGTEYLILRNAERYNLKIVDMTGQQAYENKNIGNIENISISNWNKGVYILILENENEFITEKIIVQ